uniref:SEFIR domain-containing protein n=1 Tax=Ignavibacterium album TaxID=591197 RepID=A0A7V3E7J0_9BACT
MKNPKVFISYSWSSPQHEQWVLSLAEQLVSSGVDVILDKWDLKEGYDAIVFMEKMVTDSEINKVIIVSDRVYAQKADNRKGGVGTETQIISKEIYEKVEQNKFVVIITEKNEKGEPYLPVYYKSRIYIDLSEPDNYSENFERLLRWIFDKPLYKKPEIGKASSFLSNDQQLSLETTAQLKIAIDAIKSGKSYSKGFLDDYFEKFSQNLEKFRIKKYEGEFDDAIIKNIEAFLPYRDEVINIISIIAKYDPKEEYIKSIHRFFESLIPYMFNPSTNTSYHDWDFDNFRFIIHELFLYAIAILVKSEQYHHASTLINQHYYIFELSYYRSDVMRSFTVFHQYMRSLENRNQRLKLNRLSLRADLIRERCQKIGVEFRYLMQADFILYIRSMITPENQYVEWWPETLVFLRHYLGPFEIFARAESKKYFEKIKCLFEIESPNEFKELLEEYRQNRRYLPHWQYQSFNPAYLLNIEKLATLP